MSLLAFTRPVPRTIAQCQLTHLAREPIDFERATEQHEQYEAALRSLGCVVRRLPGADAQPDSVFIEDTAVVLDECAVIARPGAAARRGETAVVAEALRAQRRLFEIVAPGTLDGGDVLRVGRHLYVGLSTRTNVEGARQLAQLVAPFGYAVDTAAVRDCLHLKTAVSALPDNRLLLNSRMVDGASFGAAAWIEIDAGEPYAGNVLCVGQTVLCPASAPRTRRLLEAEGYAVLSLDASELAKAEGGLTCCSLILRADDRA